MNKSTYYDFSSTFVWSWRIQSYLFKNVDFYYDKPQKCYCRRIKNVKGELIGGWFYPKPNLLVNYKQKIS